LRQYRLDNLPQFWGLSLLNSHAVKHERAQLDYDQVCVVSNISHSYRSRSALINVSFVLRKGSVTGLVGSNGSGKSTLLRILAGIQRAKNGRIFQFGEDIAESEMTGQGVGAVTDGMSLWQSWSVQQNLRYIAHLAGAQKSDIEQVMKLVNIAAEKQTRLRKLSLGNRQRALLAAAIIAGKRILLLDEPMNGLDPEARQQVRDIIVNLSAQERTVLLSSHDLTEVEYLCDNLLVLDQGRIIYSGKITEFLHTTRMSVISIDHDNFGGAQRSLSQAKVHSHRDTSGNLVVFTHDISAAKQTLASAGIQIFSIKERQATLAERFHGRN